MKNYPLPNDDFPWYEDTHEPKFEAMLQAAGEVARLKWRNNSAMKKVLEMARFGPALPGNPGMPPKPKP